jgi:hypothetical protein
MAIGTYSRALSKCVRYRFRLHSEMHFSTTTAQFTTSHYTILIAMFTFLATYAIGWGRPRVARVFSNVGCSGCLPWSINGEIYAHAARNTCMPLAAACNWLCNMTVALTFLSIATAAGTTSRKWCGRRAHAHRCVPTLCTHHRVSGYISIHDPARNAR